MNYPRADDELFVLRRISTRGDTAPRELVLIRARGDAFVTNVRRIHKLRSSLIVLLRA